jgi:hypothetical protein
LISRGGAPSDEKSTEERTRRRKRGRREWATADSWRIEYMKYGRLHTQLVNDRSLKKITSF